eukprot:26163-Amphidinium_carterae.1
MRQPAEGGNSLKSTAIADLQGLILERSTNRMVGVILKLVDQLGLGDTSAVGVPEVRYTSQC